MNLKLASFSVFFSDSCRILSALSIDGPALAFVD